MYEICEIWVEHTFLDGEALRCKGIKGVQMMFLGFIELVLGDSMRFCFLFDLLLEKVVLMDLLFDLVSHDR